MNTHTHTGMQTTAPQGASSAGSTADAIAAAHGFVLSAVPLQPEALRTQLLDTHCGGCVVFEGWVRDHNDGRRVLQLEYEAFAPLACSEGRRILLEAQANFGLTQACCAHRVGTLPIGGLAVWVGVATAHRGEAFDACRYIIDEIKHRLPIWKKEYYFDGDSGWVNCERCGPDHAHRHD